jgi:hypothetical protein
MNKLLLLLFGVLVIFATQSFAEEKDTGVGKNGVAVRLS